MSKTYLKMAIVVMRLVGQNPREFGRNKDIDLVSLTEVEFPTHARSIIVLCELLKRQQRPATPVRAAHR